MQGSRQAQYCKGEGRTERGWVGGGRGGVKGGGSNAGRYCGSSRLLTVKDGITQVINLISLKEI